MDKKGYIYVIRSNNNINSENIKGNIFETEEKIISMLSRYGFHTILSDSAP